MPVTLPLNAALSVPPTVASPLTTISPTIAGAITSQSAGGGIDEVAREAVTAGAARDGAVDARVTRVERVLAVAAVERVGACAAGQRSRCRRRR